MNMSLSHLHVALHDVSPADTSTDWNHLIGLIYEGGHGMDVWRAALAGIQARSGAQGAAIQHQPARPARARLVATNGTMPELVLAVVESAAECRASLLQPGGMGSELSIALPESRPSGIPRIEVQRCGEGFAISSERMLPAGGALRLVLWRADQAFGDGAVAEAIQLVPHFVRALHLQRRTQNSDLDLYNSALDCMRIGVTVVDAACAVVAANEAARELLHNYSGLSIQGGRLSCGIRADERRLQRAVQKVMQAPGEAGAEFVAERLEMPPHVQVLLRRLPLSSAWISKGPLALVILGAPEGEWRVPYPLLRQLFCLTDTESKVVGELINGYGVSDIAVRFGVQRNTIRTHLRTIFHKTGVCRQSQLVKLVYRSVLTFCGSDSLELSTSARVPVENKRSRRGEARPVS